MSKENLWSQQLSMQLEKTNLLLKVLIRLNLENIKTLVDKVKLLDSFGLSNLEVAEILGITPNAVSVYKVRIHKTKGKGKREEEKVTATEKSPNSTV